ncbi:TetR/AcrR family transcriptional regulator [Isoptericola variabilis]|uniref:TetR/AcrR family transcriptional regulator n=1 Tax=Isoptericola variabilis TaxID=139208 RepID=UPI003D20F29E
MDKRVERTAEALRTAVLELAAEQDVAALTASAVAARAGINRATFYDHAASPADLLGRVLGVELDRIRAEFDDAVREVAGHATHDDAEQVVARYTGALQAHVDAHLPVYERALEGGLSAPLARLLADHVADTLTDHLRAHPGLMPLDPGTPADQVDRYARAFATYVGLGTVGALEVWLSAPPPRDPAFFARVAHDALPAWWTTPSP